MDWQPIETAPEDRLPVYVKRIYERRIVVEGEAVFAELHPHAPSRQPMGLDPLGRLSAADYAREAAQTAEWASEAKWLKPDRMFAFPTPTHWSPDKTAELRKRPSTDWTPPPGYPDNGGEAG